MRVTINNEQTNNKDLIYEEGFWTGKRTIVYNGETLTKLKRNIFVNKAGEEFVIKGNQLVGVTITTLGKQVEVLRKLTWLEIALSVLVFVPCVLFGAIGGAFGGGLGFTNVMLLRKIDKLYLKIIISLLMTGLAVLLSYIFAYLIFKFAIFI